MLNVTPSSDEKDFRGDSVPDVRTIVRTLSLISEKAYTETWNKRDHLFKKPNTVTKLLVLVKISLHLGQSELTTAGFKHQKFSTLTPIFCRECFLFFGRAKTAFLSKTAI